MESLSAKMRVFTWMSLLTGLLYAWLWYQMLFTPAELLQGFGIVNTDVRTLWITKRVSILMLGFAVLLFLACRLKTSPGRAVVASAVAVNMGGFAINTFWGWSVGMLTAPEIPVVGSIETFIALVYACFAVADFRTATRRAKG